ncbi:MAG TPA: hypothetical protein VLW53_16635, partial [Candidatus Eisenbacteria bacterium]|nr:hypothetical protein [Candidatus Eisenbacteria bacterium]
MALHDALGSRWVVYIGRAVAAVALLFGLAAAAPVLLVDAAAASGSTSLPSAALQLIFLTSTANLAGYPVLLAGAVAVVAPALARGGRLDSIGLLVIAFAWALAFLPQSVLLADGRTPALDGVLVVGTATLVVALVSGRLSSRGRHVVVAVCGIATVAVLEAWFIEPSSRGSLIWASAIPAAIAAFGATIAYWWLPQVAWRQAFPRTFAITLVALVALPCEMAAAAVLAAGEDQTRAAAVL